MTEEANPVRPNVTLRDIASRANCSHMTVSRALRNEPCLAPDTRKRIQKLAKQMGYRANPVVATLMTQLRNSRRIRMVANLAWIEHHAPGDEEHRGICSYAYPFAKKHAYELGYQMDSFWIQEPGLTVNKLNKVLHSRNIHGVILAPGCPRKIFWPLQWDRLSVVAIGRTPFQPTIHRVIPDEVANQMLAHKRLLEIGYQRIGLVIPEWEYHVPLNMGGDFIKLGSLREETTLQVPTLRLPDFGPEGENHFWSFLERHQLEALICSGGKTLRRWLERRNLSVPKDLGLAEIDLMSSPCTRKNWSGIDIHHDQLGISAVDLLVSELQNNRLGLPSFSKAITIKGDWIAGSTIRKPTSTKPDRQPGPVIGILVRTPLHWEPNYYLRKLVYSLETSLSGMGKDSAMVRKRNLESEEVPNIPSRLTSRIYEGLGIPRMDPSVSFSLNCQRLSEDLRYHEFRGWILVDVASTQLPPSIEMEIDAIPHVKACAPPLTDVCFDDDHFIQESFKCLLKSGSRHIACVATPYLMRKYDAAATALGVVNFERIPFETVRFVRNKSSLYDLHFENEKNLQALILKKARQWKLRKRVPHGLIVWDDVFTRTVALALAQEEVLVPQQMKVVTPVNQGIHIPYAVPVIRYERPLNKYVKEVVRILICRMEGKPTGLLPVKLKGKMEATR